MKAGDYVYPRIRCFVRDFSINGEKSRKISLYTKVRIKNSDGKFYLSDVYDETMLDINNKDISVHVTRFNYMVYNVLNRTSLPLQLQMTPSVYVLDPNQESEEERISKLFSPYIVNETQHAKQ